MALDTAGPLASTGGASLDDIVSQQKALVQTLGQLVETLQALFPRATGTFTMTAAASITVADTAVAGTSFITWTPTNAGAGTLEGSVEKLYLSARSAGTSFTLTTAAGTAATGGETYQYAIFNPL